MPKWIKEIYRLLLWPNGRRRDINKYKAMKVYTKEGKAKWWFCEEACDGCAEVITLKEFIQRKIDIKCRNG